MHFFKLSFKLSFKLAVYKLDQILYILGDLVA